VIVQGIPHWSVDRTRRQIVLQIGLGDRLGNGPSGVWDRCSLREKATKPRTRRLLKKVKTND
jgi:hypothetical protein